MTTAWLNQDSPHSTSPRWGDADTLPLVAIAGSRGKTTVAWLLDQIMRSSGGSVGSWISSGVYVNGEQQAGELHPWKRVLLAGKYGELDLILQEMPAPMVVGVGLPEETYPIAVVTTICGNDESCRISEESRLEQRALDMLMQSIRKDGLVIGNADDPVVTDRISQSACNQVLFALHRDNPILQHHLREGKLGVWVEDGWIRYGGSNYSQRIVSVDSIPATIDGTLAFQVQNTLAAIGAAMAIGIDVDTLNSVLQQFKPNPELQPAVCNIIEFGRSRIVVDSPKRVWSLRMLTRGIRQQPYRRILVMTGCFPEMDDDDAREAGRIVGSLSGVIILHEQNVDEERVQLVKSALASNPVPPLVLTKGRELEAVDKLLNAIGPNDVGLVLADNPDTVLKHLWPAPNVAF